MMIEFKDDDVEIMREILEIYLHDLTGEISSTETFAFREDLKRKKHFVMDLLGSLTRKAA
jgi:hypothetical protein